MTRASEIIDLELLDHYLTDGVVRRQVHPDDDNLAIYKYTERAVALGDWTPTLRTCRGLIIRHEDGGDHWLEGEVAARGFNKFFNAEERESAWIKDVSPDSPALAYAKIDGSCGLIYRAPDDRLAVATMGSFASEQALHATNVLRERYEAWLEEQSLFWGATVTGRIFTPVVEIVYPGNRIVVDEGMDDLVYLAAIEVGTGVAHTPLLPDGNAFWPGPHADCVLRGTLREALTVPETGQREGLVLHVRVGDEWRLAKRKEPWYVEAHRVVTGLSERVVWEKLGAVGLDATFDWATESLDAEHAEWASEVAERLWVDESAIYVRALIKAADLDRQHPNRPDFARHVMAEIPDKNERAGVFLAYDKNLDKLMKWAHTAVRPVGNTKAGSPVRQDR